MRPALNKTSSQVDKTRKKEKIKQTRLYSFVKTINYHLKNQRSKKPLTSN